MNEYIIILLIGIGLGIIDILPMLMKKMDTYSILSAFVFHLIMPFILFNLNSSLPWFLKGGLIYGLCALPVVILAAHEDKKSVPIILCTSILLGTVAAFILNLIAF